MYIIYIYDHEPFRTYNDNFSLLLLIIVVMTNNFIDVDPIYDVDYYPDSYPVANWRMTINIS